jgi:hypothetical protein
MRAVLQQAAGPTTCGVHMHAIGNDGTKYTGKEGSFQMRSIDSMLVSTGRPLGVPTPLTLTIDAPDTAGGVHFSLVIISSVWNAVGASMPIHFF